ncbi:hypothetical protein PLICRDRAFT_53147 [Plicaturopsis crispa FD-325 SS-3]|nr:hypothetical protein PLICRDRAFT_53147 [Plicaturopsis crispa FD-325 SS-3]
MQEASRSTPARSSSELAKEKEYYREQISNLLEDDDDPLTPYDRFIQWTVKNYAKDDPESGLLELLEETTRKFKDDEGYKGDLRYLKLWLLYAQQVEKPSTVYAFLIENKIGLVFSLLYEEYADVLEKEGRRSEADQVYALGIKRQARPRDRLKKRYLAFQERGSSPATADARPSPPSSSKSSSSKSTSSKSTDLRLNPLRNHTPPTRSTPSPLSNNAANSTSLSGANHDRYLPMLAPPAPGKRPEKLRFNLSLLFTEEGVEYSAAEARARSMGLLGKKWGPPPASELRSTSSTAVRVQFNDDGTRNRTGGLRRKSVMGGAEPTVTINTKEALADVFGMYNSPEKTMRVAPGSKHAPVKRIEPITPIVRPLPTLNTPANNENAVVKAPGPAFRPFVDENAGKKVASGPAKFKPFVDDTANKTPSATDVSRRALAVKDAATPSLPRVDENAGPRSLLRPLAVVPEDPGTGSVFSKVFTPAPRDVFSHASSDPALEAPNVLQVSTSTSGTSFTPFIDPNSRTPFKVFSRPPSQNENAFTPKTPSATFRPFVDGKDGQTPRLVLGSRAPLQPPAESFIEEVDETAAEAEAEYKQEQEQEVQDEADESYIEEQERYDATPEPLDHAEGDGYEDAESYHVPLGGRFGEFNVMTPITERTYDFTTSTRAPTTPNELDQSMVEHGAVKAAERLAAELREEEEREEALARARNTFIESSQHENYDDSFVDEGHDDQEHDGQELPQFLIEKTGALSFSETLTLASSFKPANPCNPFDPPIVSTLLSIIPSDSGFHDMTSHDAQLLDGLQKFAQKKQRRASGNTSSSDTGGFPLTIAGRKFNVTGKLGEGGFGAVFAARDISKQPGDEDEDEDDYDEDEDEGGSSMLALKVVKPKNLWEFHVLRRMRSKLAPNLRASVVVPHDLYAFRDESFLVLELSPQGTLLDIVNRASQAGVSQQGACLDELLVMFFAIELMRLVEGMHSAGFIHGDLKIDNCLIRLEDVPGGASAWSSVYQPSGDDGWSHKGVRVIDFGRTIDTALFPAGQTFIAEWPTDARDCFEMREDRPWTYQPDYFGLAGIIYCMLFGKYIESSSVVSVPASSPGGPSRYKISTPLKRYWQNDLWTKLFDVLLNPCLVHEDGHMPLCDELGEIRVQMEKWLQGNCNRTSNTLKGLLKKIERSLLDSR